MANTKKTAKRGTKSTKRTSTAPKTGRAKVAKGKSETWRSAAAREVRQTRRANAMHANNPG